ncbi:hypothetical protein EDC04DRAFT_2961584 [Pisolithus marmoratus]|nr:hypothetical protein EDC04DRAFT_2961584 [Pisolithus marmoratus]
MSFLQNSSEDHHYHGRAHSQPSLANALENPDAELCPEKFCFQHISENQLCWKTITCGSISEHMRYDHGVLAQPPNEHVTCKWNDCGQSITRKNIYRHIRETHLEHKRGVGHIYDEKMEAAELIMMLGPEGHKWHDYIMGITTKRQQKAQGPASTRLFDSVHNYAMHNPADKICVTDLIYSKAAFTIFAAGGQSGLHLAIPLPSSSETLTESSRNTCYSECGRDVWSGDIVSEIRTLSSGPSLHIAGKVASLPNYPEGSYGHMTPP